MNIIWQIIDITIKLKSIGQCAGLVSVAVVRGCLPPIEVTVKAGEAGTRLKVACVHIFDWVLPEVEKQRMSFFGSDSAVVCTESQKKKSSNCIALPKFKS